MTVFRQSPSKYRRRGGGVKMRYLWCRFNFWGQFCDKFFFHYMVLGMDLEIFALAVCLCANITITYVWIWITPKSEGASPNFFQKLYKTLISIRSMQKTPETLHHFWTGFPWKRDIQQKLQFSRPPCTNCVRGWCSRYGAFFRGFNVLLNGRSMIAIFA